jgi:hypothetical protein
MNSIVDRTLRALLLFPLFAALASCAFGPELTRGPADDRNLTGSYTLILYGCNYSNDLETVAVLDPEGDEYSFQPYAPNFEYRLWKGVPAREALEAAREFVHCNPSFSHAQMSSLNDSAGNVIGFEVRPLYFTFTYGLPDVIDVSYWLQGNKVLFSVELLPSIERMLFNTGTNRGDDRR